MCQLIVVEGIMGSGKPTTAEFVFDRLVADSVSVQLIGENHENHPIQMQDPEAYESIDVWMSERIDKWDAWTRSILKSDDVFVLDGQLFHESVDSLFYFDVSENDIVGFMERLMVVIEPVHPALVYFYQNDVRASLRKTFDDRSEGWEKWQIDWKLHGRPYGQSRNLKGFDGFVQLYGAYRQLTDRLFADLEIEIWGWIRVWWIGRFICRAYILVF